MVCYVTYITYITNINIFPVPSSYTEAQFVKFGRLYAHMAALRLIQMIFIENDKYTITKNN